MMANPAPYYHNMEPAVKIKQEDGVKHCAGGSDKSSNDNKLPVKIKDEPPDWSLNNSSTNPYCGGGGGMPPFMPPMHHNMYPGPPMGMMHPMPGQLPMNGMARHPMAGLGPPPLAHPPHHPLPMPTHCTGPTHNMSTQPSDMPVIKQEPLDAGFHNSCPQPCSTMNSSTSTTNTTSTAATNKKSKKATKKDKVNTNAVVKKEIKQEKLTDSMPTKKKRDRFNGMSEEEVLKRTLPDHLCPNLDIIIIGINPGLTAAYVGHHYAGPGNHMWKCLYLSGLIPEPMNAYDDYKLQELGIGFTNIVERTSRGSADLTKKEIKEGGEILLSKVQKYKPKIAVFNGKGIYEVFCGHKNFYIGKQPEKFPGSTDTYVYVMPSSSARCSQLPRAVDKVPFFMGIKKLRDYCIGATKELDDSECTFPDLELKVEPRKDKEERLKREALTNGTPLPVVSVGKKKASKRKSTDNDMLDNMAMNAMNYPHQQGMPPFPHPAGPYGPPMGFPWQQHPGLPGLAGLPGAPMPTSAIDSMFSSPPMLVKQEDMTELANYGITSSTFSGPQSYLSGCPAPNLPTVSHPGPWHNAATANNNSSSAAASAQFPPGFGGMAAPPPTSQNSLPSPASYHGNNSNSSLSPHQMAQPSGNPSFPANGHSFPSPSYMQQQQQHAPSNQNNLSPGAGGPPHTPGPMSPSYPQGPPPYPSSQYPFNGSSGGQPMGFG